MTVSLRVRARRNHAGSVLEWHPDDRGRAEEVLVDHRAVIQLLYQVVDRRKLSDKQEVLRMDVLEETRRVDSVQLREDARRDLPIERLATVRDNIEASIGGPASA